MKFSFSRHTNPDYRLPKGSATTWIASANSKGERFSLRMEITHMHPITGTSTWVIRPRLAWSR